MSSFADPLLSFWFGELDDRGWAAPAYRNRWYRADPAFDEALREQFLTRVEAAINAGAQPVDDPEVALANVLLLDQLPRNLFRGDARAFSGDSIALTTAERLQQSGRDEELPLDARLFCWMPFEHAESLNAQNTMVRLITQALANAASPDQERLNNALHHALEHRSLIEQFGRFPHRNAALGRQSTNAELDYLATGKRFGQ